MALLAFLFLATALLYSMAGFGGGSTYNALLVLHGTDYRLLPAIALTCNIIVVMSGTIQFLRARHIALRDVVPLVLLSAPLAWLGGRTPVPETLFIGLLGFALLAAGAFMLVDPPAPAEGSRRRGALALSVAYGGGIGFLSGLVGIGGGIFLAPFLHLVRWGGAQRIAGAASFFILVNSSFGLAGQLIKLNDLERLETLAAYWPLPLAVLAGGVAGSFLAAYRLPAGAIKKVTGALILVVAARLLWRLAQG